MTPEEINAAQADLDAQIAALTPEERERLDQGTEGLVAAFERLDDELRRRRSVAILNQAARWYGEQHF